MSHALVRLTLSRYAPVAPGRGPSSRTSTAVPGGGARGTRGCASTSATRTGWRWWRWRRDVDVGVDVEDAQRTGETAGIAGHYFAPSEVAGAEVAGGLASAGALLRVLDLEGGVHQGAGAGALPAAGAVRVRAAAWRASADLFDPRLKDDPESWQFVQLGPSQRHMAAVAVRRARTLLMEGALSADPPARPRSGPAVPDGRGGMRRVRRWGTRRCLDHCFFFGPYPFG